MLDGLAALFDDELRGGDDRALWEDVAARVAGDVAALDRLPEAPPRHVTLVLARVRRARDRARPGAHPDDHATLHLAWERDRGDATFRFAGRHPHVRSRHGAYSATVCVPAGTNRPAWVEALVLWRPRRPWGPPEDHETGRQTYRYRRESDGSWRFLGTEDG